MIFKYFFFRCLTEKIRKKITQFAWATPWSLGGWGLGVGGGGEGMAMAPLNLFMIPTWGKPRDYQ